ncbi:hypothetical protein K8354_17390 [Polaribacter litorisediminis]|uniref:hypothetical protein n=1 Tax=Polaribacter litorisediminis TaxID=1908341 RepID=UPI001CC16A77|nr:hypothetical protein [Polaribacter litorisediminis]UAM98034.1 hypothetical protein K8354_17390 [Polaribacter litorisediminis]
MSLKKTTYFKFFVAFLVLSFLGFLILPKLSVRLNLNESLPSISVSYSCANASPYTSRREVIIILEGSFSTLKDFTKINFKSSRK